MLQTLRTAPNIAFLISTSYNFLSQLSCWMHQKFLILFTLFSVSKSIPYLWRFLVSLWTSGNGKMHECKYLYLADETAAPVSLFHFSRVQIYIFHVRFRIFSKRIGLVIVLHQQKRKIVMFSVSQLMIIAPKTYLPR